MHTSVLQTKTSLVQLAVVNFRFIFWNGW